ncbi:MAG TPA: hypothetical protein VID20_07465, partial [Sphingomicrobium sp.]
EPDLQLHAATSAAATTASATATASAATGDADVSGRIGDSGDCYLPGASASTATAAGARAGRSVSFLVRNWSEGIDPLAPFIEEWLISQPRS